MKRLSAIHIFKRSSNNKSLIRFFVFLLLFLFSNQLQAKIHVTGISVSATQTGIVNYGSGSSATYTITLSENGGGSGTTTFTLNWTTIPSGVTSNPTGYGINLTGNGQTVTLTLYTQNTTPAGTYSFTVTESDGRNTSNTASFVVNSLPLVTLSINNSSISETGGVAVVTATLSKIHNQTVSVYLQIDGSSTATNGNDYTFSGYTLTIPAGSLSANTSITAISDFNDESDETVIVYVNSVGNGTENGVQQVTTTIIDDDTTPTVTLSTNKLVLVESGEIATITATLSNTIGVPVTVYLDYGGSAAHPNDYNNPTYSVTIPANSLTGSVNITSVEDAIAEGNETVLVSIGSVQNGLEQGNQEISVIVIDNDVAGITVYPVSNLTTTENGGTASFSVVLNTQPTADVTITLYSNDPTEGTISSGSLTFTNLNWNTPQQVTISGVADGIVDGDYGYTIITNASTSSDAFYNGINPSDVSVTNIDNGIVSSFSAVLSGSSTICSGSSTNLVVTISGGGTSPYTVIYTDGTSNFTENSYTSGSNILVTPTSTITYTLVSVIDAGSNASSSNTGSAVVTVNTTSPTFTAHPNPSECQGDNVTYTTESGMLSYSWSVPGTSGADYSITSGGTSTDYTVTLKWLTTGSKTVTVGYTGVNGCTSATPASSIITVNPTPVIGTFN